MVSLSLDMDSGEEVPTLHVVYHIVEQATLLSARPYSESSFPEQTRQELIAWIASEALAGDLEAAEWVLLSIISRV